MKPAFRILASACVFAFVIGPLGTAMAQAQTPTTVAQASSGTIIGTATDSNGAALPGATITASGPTTQSTTTDSSGAYVLTLPPGIYRITATKPGYSAAEQTDYAVIGGVQSALNVTLSAATLTSLREIGRVNVNAGARSGFNSTPASVVALNTQVFLDQTQPQVQRVLDQTPGIVIDHPGTSATNAAPGAITIPSIRGGLAFETASLIDGHPLAVGSFGDYVTTFLNSFFLQNVEVIKGPGAAAPEVNFAIGGTVNFRTKEPTRKPFGQLIVGTDSYGGVISNYLYSGTTTNGKLGWVLEYGVNGSPGPLQNANGFVNLGSSVLINGVAQRGFTTNAIVNPNVQNNPFFGSSTLISCCLPVSQTYDNKSELVKLRYNISPVTQFTASYLGSQTWTEQNGNHVNAYQQLFTPGASYAGGVNNLPAAGSTVQTWQNVFFPSGEWEINNEPIFQAELRTTFGNDIVLGRFYAASINRLQYNAVQSPNDSYVTNQTLFGTFTNSAGATVTYTGQTVPITFIPTGPVCQNAAGYWTACAAGQAAQRYSSPFYFRGIEEDKLHGGSFEYDHFLGNTGNTISFAYDQTNSGTHSYDYDSSPGAPTIPAGSRQQFQTFLLRGIFNVGERLNVTLSNYLNLYYQRYSTNKGVTAAQSAAYVAANPGALAPIVGDVNPLLSFTDTRYSHYDARLGLAYRASRNASLRAAVGSAIAPPYLFLLNAGTTSPVVSMDGTFATNTVNAGAALRPETSFGYDVGGDFRLSGDGLTVLSTDLYRTNLFNQFVTATFSNGTIIGPSGTPIPLFSSTNANLSNARYEGIELAVRRDPALGLGFIAQGALVHAYPYNVSPCFYSTTVLTGGVLDCTKLNTNLGIIPGINFQNSGTSGSPGGWNSVSNHSEPYSQGYGELHYRFMRDGYVSIGEQYYGNNNSLNVPAFFIGNATVRVPIGSDATKLWAQLSIDNLYNTYGNNYITAMGGVGVPLLNGKIGLTNANVIGPRNFRFTITKNFGG